jgi:hypothetical protein
MEGGFDAVGLGDMVLVAKATGIFECMAMRKTRKINI